MITTSARRFGLCILCILCAATAASAQGRPRAELTPVVERPTAAAGAKVRLALKVDLPNPLS